MWGFECDPLWMLLMLTDHFSLLRQLLRTSNRCAPCGLMMGELVTLLAMLMCGIVLISTPSSIRISVEGKFIVIKTLIIFVRKKNQLFLISSAVAS